MPRFYLSVWSNLSALNFHLMTPSLWLLTQTSYLDSTHWRMSQPVYLSHPSSIVFLYISWEVIRAFSTFNKTEKSFCLHAEAAKPAEIGVVHLEVMKVYWQKQIPDQIHPITGLKLRWSLILVPMLPIAA